MKQEREVVRVTREAGIAWVTLHRPEVLNALNREMLADLSSLLVGLDSDAEVKAVVITGAGEKAFSAGADISFLSTAAPLEVRAFARLAVDTFHLIETRTKPVIAAINGYALGGGLELAEACMLRVVAEHAVMGHPEVRIGAVAGWGGTTRLARLVGRGRAAELLLTGRHISAADALSMGLVNRVVPSDRLRAEATSLASEIIAQAPLAVRLSWEALHRGLNLTLEESTALGVDAFGLVASTEDFREGTKAFLEQRKPSYRGR